MKRTLLQAILILTGIAALAITTSCYEELTNDFQALDETSGTDVKLVDVTTGSLNAYQIFKARRVAQQFKITSRHQILGARIKLIKNGDWSSYSTGRMRAQIFSNNSGQPGSPQGNITSEPLVDGFPASEPTSLDGFIPFEFVLKPTLSAGTYWLVFSLAETTDGVDSVDYVSFYVDSNGLDNNVAYGISSPYAVEKGDLSIVLYAKTVP